MTTCSAASNPSKSLSTFFQRDRSLQQDRLYTRRLSRDATSFRTDPTENGEIKLNEFLIPFDPKSLPAPIFDPTLWLSGQQGGARVQNPKSNTPALQQDSLTASFQSYTCPQTVLGSPRISNSPFHVGDFTAFLESSKSNSAKATSYTGQAIFDRFNQSQKSNSLPFTIHTQIPMLPHSLVRTGSSLGSFTDSTELPNVSTWESCFEQLEAETKALDHVGKQNIEVLRWPPEISEFADYLPYLQSSDVEWHTIAGEESAPQVPIHRALDSYQSQSFDLSAKALVEEGESTLISTDSFREGVEIIKNRGSLPLAISKFQAAIVYNPAHFAAWQQLGMAQAENGFDAEAIRSLEKALALEPNDLMTLMSIAVSYSNEGYNDKAHLALAHWLSVKYPEIVKGSNHAAFPLSSEMRFTERRRLQNVLMDLYINAATVSSAQGEMDSDVQLGLGILLYNTQDFAKAADCFYTAIEWTESLQLCAESQIHLLWNRLGATFARQDRQEDAIAAYDSAIAFSPNSVRTRCNLGVAYVRSKRYSKAASVLLDAIQRQQGSEDNSVQTGDPSKNRSPDKRASALHYSLKTALGGMGRNDLKDLVSSNVDVAKIRRAIAQSIH